MITGKKSIHSEIKIPYGDGVCEGQLSNFAPSGIKMTLRQGESTQVKAPEMNERHLAK